MSRRSFFSFTATRPVAISMVVLAALVFGLVGLNRLPFNLLPDISYPTVTIRTEYPGATPQDVEERVSKRIQEAVSVITGVRRVVSVSRPGVSDVVLEFRWGTNIMFAVSDVHERLDRVFLPKEAERPLVLRYDPSLDPVMTLGVAGDEDLVELRRIAEEEIERELAKVEGVAAVKLRGGDEEEIRISVDEDALAYYGLDITRLAQRLAAENINAASGVIEERKTEYLVRALGEFQSLKEIADLIVERRGDASIRLRDVAEVRRVPADREVMSRIGGKPCVLVDIYKEAGANVVRLCERVRQRVFGTAAQRAYVDAGKHLAAASAPRELADARTPEQRRAAHQRARARAIERQRMTDYLAFQVAPSGVRLDVLQDQSRFIRSSIHDVLSAAIQGGTFAIAVIYLFLRRFSATAILAVSIPVSLVSTFAPMFLSDIDLNIMSLGGLALGVGMMVDNSIVVLESIHRAREESRSAAAAAVVGVSQVASAATASTLTTVAVFFPIVFVEGIAGQLFRDQALTVVFSLLLSLLVALFVIPMLATRTARHGRKADSETRPPWPARPRRPALRPWWKLPFRAAETVVRWLLWPVAALLTAATIYGSRTLLVVLGALGVIVRALLWPVAFAFDRAWRLLDSIYPRVVEGSLRLRPLVLAVAAGLLAFSLSRVNDLGSELLPEVHQGELFLDAFLPRDATVERTDRVLAPIERRIAALPDVESTFLACGVDKEELHDSDQGEHSARILVRMVETHDRVAQESRVRDAIREIVRREPAIVSYRFARPSILAFTAPLVVEVLGKDLVALRRACAQVVDALASVPGLRDVRSTLQRGNPEISIRLDRDKVAALGLETRAVTDILRTKIQGDAPTRFTERERKIDIRVRLDRAELDTVARLRQINVNPAGLPVIPLGSIASIRRMEGPSEIRRLGNMRGAEVQAAVSGFDLASAQERVLEALAGLSLPHGVTARLGGQKEDMEQSLQSLTMALLLAVFLVYIVMASQFESLVQPLVILVTLPLALVGSVLTLYVLNIPLSVIVFLGAIVLAGIVVNNAIILIDQINRLRAGGTPKFEAIVRGAHLRLRPVLMTTVTTVLGLLPLTGWLGDLPLVGGSGEGVELRGPMAVTVISGLVTSTLLTLVVVPVVYSFSDRRS